MEESLESHDIHTIRPSYYRAILNNQEVIFEEISTSSQGDCGFEALGIEREDAVSLLFNISANPVMRNLLRNEIKAAFYQGELEHMLTAHSHKMRAKEFFDIYENIQNNYLEQANLDSLLDTFCLEKEVYEDYVRSYYGAGGWLTIIPNFIGGIYIPGNSSALDALAVTKGLNVYVWQQGQDNSLIPMHRSLYGNSQAEESIHMLHTYASEDGKTRNHFTSLKKIDSKKQDQLLGDPGDHAKHAMCLPMINIVKGTGKNIKLVGVEIKNVGRRIVKSNNRSLGTLFGCIAGLIVGILLVTEGAGSLPLVGDPSLLSVPYKIVGVLLATGTGGNLSSHIGASIDILTNEKTVFDLIYFGYEKTCGCRYVASLKKRHYPFITSKQLLFKESK